MNVLTIFIIITIPDIFICFVFWTADFYWNSRYSSHGISYTNFDTNNGMWSHHSDTSKKYLPDTWSIGCSGCACIYSNVYGKLNSLQSCDGSVSVVSYTFPNITRHTFAKSTTDITIQECTFNLTEDAFVNLTSLSSLVIQNSGIKSLPDISNTKLTILNLIGNNISFDAKYKGTLPDSIEYLALTSNNLRWLPTGFIKGPRLRLVSLGDNAFVNFPAAALGPLPNLMYFGIETNSIKQVSVASLKALATPTFVHLNMSNNHIQFVDTTAFNQLPNLKILELHGNNLTTIQKGLFANLKELLHLDLNKNKIETLKEGSFVNLEKLIELRLHSQNPPLARIYYKAFLNIGKSLKYLFIGSNGLSHLPHHVFMEENFTELCELDADNNFITNVTELDENSYGVGLRHTFLEKKKMLKPFKTTPNLIRLFLNGNLIGSINNTDFCQLKSLQLLEMSSNKLTESTIEDDGFKCLSSLNSLYLGSNRIQYVPVAVTTHEKLRAINTLSMDNNIITFLESGTFSNVSTLYYLNLQGNRIIAVEDGAFPAQIRQINLFGNRFRFVHTHQFAYLEELMFLNLGSNEITILPDDVFSNTTSLNYLYLSNNKISQIKKVHFSKCPLTNGLSISNNKIGWIEDGSLNHVTTSYIFDFSYNRLYKLPMNGTFHDLSLVYFYLNNNRISFVPPGTFKNVRCSLVWNFQNNRISTIASGSFRDITVGHNFDFTNNNIQLIETDAFYSVSVGLLVPKTYNGEFSFDNNLLGEIEPKAFSQINCNVFKLRNRNIVTIRSNSFNSFTCNTVYLESSGIHNIERNAFYNFVANDNLFLQNNQITALTGNIFGGSSHISQLYLNNNKLKEITSDAFLNVSVDFLYMNDNQLTVYPIALSYIFPIQINLYNNMISGISTRSFAGQTRLQYLYLYNNRLTQIPEKIFTLASKLKVLDLHDNQIQQINDGAFDGLQLLETLNLAQNVIPYFRALDLPKMQTLNLANNRIETLGGFSFGKSLSNVILSNNALGCECSTVESLYNVRQALSADTQCSSPTEVNGVLFATSQETSLQHFSKVDKHLFQCNAESIKGAFALSTNITVTWTRPSLKYFLPNDSSSSDIEIATKATDAVTYWVYLVTCTSNTAPTLTKYHTVNSTTNHTGAVFFTDLDGLLPLTLYECVIQLTIENYTSARSVPTFIYTAVTSSIAIGENGTSSNNTEGAIATEHFFLNLTFLDFSVNHDDFGFTANRLQRSPRHVISPLGSWLAIANNPTTDSFSDWFRSTDSNIQISGRIALSRDESITSSMIYSFVSNNFYPVDNLGYGSEGQTDCSNILHNFGFTTSYRSGIKFQGSERITLGGGEEIWLFVNRILVLEIVSNRTSSTKACQTVDFSNEGQFGKWIAIRKEGYIFDEDCVGLQPLSDAYVQLELEVGETYLFEIFHAERQRCTSEFLIRFQDVYLTLNEMDTKPFDYILSVKEDLHLNGIVGTFDVWDVFASGPFHVEVVTGNEARHFTLKNDTAFNRNATATIVPPTYLHNTVQGTNKTYVECTTSSGSAPVPYILGSEFFFVTTSEVLLTLSSKIDFELKHDYAIFLSIEDMTTSAIGSLIIKIKVEDVNDNCPELSAPLYITPQPLLQKDPLFILNSSDLDSGINKEVKYYMSKQFYQNPVIDYQKSLDIRRQVYNSSTEITIQMYAIDEGTPSRGVSINVTVNISNTCLIDETFKRTNFTLILNETSGTVYLRVPGYWNVNFRCLDYIGISNGIVRDELITASSFKNTTTLPSRARLGLNATSPEFGSLSGGWVAKYNDIYQYIQVSMDVPYKFTQVHIQGQEDEPNWITSFQIFYIDKNTNNWTLYRNESGEFIFLANNDRTTIRTLDFSPPILSQYIQINPRTWMGNIALRFELSGCSQTEQFYFDTSCERCYTSNYCLGDGESHKCARCDNGTNICNRSKTEHSFGAQSTCSPCRDGWICKNGYATPCERYHYVLSCNDTYCPDNCTHCEPGHACRGGQRYMCLPGTYSNGSTEHCEFCKENMYQDKPGQSSCKPCPAGYYSSKSKNRCNACDVGSYSSGNDTLGCISCNNIVECPCLDENSCFSLGSSKATCINTGGGSHICLKCPPGFIGDGVNCVDKDECALYNPCWSKAACINTAPGYQCLACPYGYKGTYEDGMGINNTVRVFEVTNQKLAPIQQQTCSDVDECLVDNGGCDLLSPCVNTIGSFYCGFCAEGYAGVPSISCYSSNFCQTGHHSCSKYAICIYLGPSEYVCECIHGYTGTGKYCGVDSDLDGHPDKVLPCNDWGCRRDNCLHIPNYGQEDVDNDNMGDDCDMDSDNDGRIDELDNCPYVRNGNRSDTDHDNVGDICDSCVFVSNPDQIDTDHDGAGDACDIDDDGDGLIDTTDNCPLVANPSQIDSDGDNIGDACDNCVIVRNTAQDDTDQNGFGDSCDPNTYKDRDGDSILDITDNCDEAENADQADTDNDGFGDACDTDLDGDGVLNPIDNCPFLSNPLQTDINGDRVGDNCAVDSDGDGIDDGNDTCPYNKFISTTSFLPNIKVDLYPGYSVRPLWKVKALDREIYQLADTMKPVMLIGYQAYRSLKYSGTVFVRSGKGENYVGVVFGYVNNRKFYLLSWKTTNKNFETSSYTGGIRGINLKVINSNTGPSQSFAYALWDSGSTENQATVLWHDGNMTKWSNYTSYKWVVTQYTDSGKIRVQMYDKESMLADSGSIYDTSITGGRVGVFQFGQPMTLWSNLKIQCIVRENKAIYFDGVDDYVSLTNLSNLNIYRSFTIGLWVKLEVPSSTKTKMPLFCTESAFLCLWIDNLYLYCQYGNNTVVSTSTLSTHEWNSLICIYDESEYSLKLYVNGNIFGQIDDVSPFDMGKYKLQEDTQIYLGKDEFSFYKGYADELAFYNIALVVPEIDDHIYLSSVDKYPTLHKYAQLYYKMDQVTGATYLKDDGLLGVPGQINGKPLFIESLQDYTRFHLEHPAN